MNEESRGGGHLRLTLGQTVLLHMESDFAWGLAGGVGESTDSVKQGFDSLVVALEAALQFGKLPGQRFVACQHPAQADEGAHDRDVDLHSPLASQDGVRWGRRSGRVARSY